MRERRQTRDAPASLAQSTAGSHSASAVALAGTIGNAKMGRLLKDGTTTHAARGASQATATLMRAATVATAAEDQTLARCQAGKAGCGCAKCGGPATDEELFEID